MKDGALGEVQKHSDREAPGSPWLCALGDRNQPPIEKQLGESAADGTRAHASQTTFTESTSPASYRRKLEGRITGRPHSTAPRFTELHFIAFFFFYNKSKVCDNLRSASVIFPTVIAHLMSLCHTLVILTIF